MKNIATDEVIRFLANSSPTSNRALSQELGRSPDWIAVSGMKGRDPKVSSIVKLADLVGVDVVLIDHESGQPLAKIDVAEK